MPYIGYPPSLSTLNYFTTLGVGTNAPATTNTTLDLNGSQVNNTVVLTGTTPVIDCSLGNYFQITTDADTTFSVTNVPVSRAYSFTLEVTNTSGALTFNFNNLTWPNGITPSLTANRTQIFIFLTRDNGTKWRGRGSFNYTT